MSSPSAVAATITKLEGSKQVEYEGAQAAAQAEAKREYSVADSGGGRGCPGGSDVGPHYAGGLVFTYLREGEYCEVGLPLYGVLGTLRSSARSRRSTAPGLRPGPPGPSGAR